MYMKIIKCRTNHIENPLGYALPHIVVTWQVEDAKSKFQTSARIQVSETSDMKSIIYDTGKCAELSNLGVQIPIQVKPRTRYYWQITVWGDADEFAVSDVNWFETGKGKETWNAKWVSPERWENKTHPYIRKVVTIPKKIIEARAYVVGLGVYDFYLNGNKVGNEYLAPGCTTYDEWTQIYTYDITESLAVGENEICFLLGNGWAKGRFGTFAMVNKPYVNAFYLLAELHLKLENGENIVIKTDDTWECCESEILDSSIYDGEICDMRKKSSNWENVQLNVPEKIKNLEDRLSPAIVVKEYVSPIEIIHTPAGEIVLDMGQNMTGWIRFHIKEPSGVTVKMRFGEILQDGNFYNENLRTAKAEYVYTSDGKERTIEPHFTFYGFRYVCLEGFTGEIDIKNFIGCVVYSDLKETGKIETTDPRVNQLFLNAKWGQKGNFLDVPTDCPQRDERMGWTGDTQVFARTASFNMETYAFYRKFLHDLWMDQRCKNGMVGNVIPGFTPQKIEQSMPYYGGSAVWGDCAVIVPWELYLQYGDKSILEEQYESMCAWVNWMTGRIEKTNDKGLWSGDYQWGDWLALDGPVKNGTAGGTDEVYIASAYYKHSAEILAQIAEILGKHEDTEKYGYLAEQMKVSIFKEYFSENGRSMITTQTAYLLALKFDLVSEDLKPRIVKDLAELLKKNKMHLQTGFVGTPFLCRVLSEYGCSDLAYQIFMQEDYPGWLYAVQMGATTIWERWDSVLLDGKISGTGMNSLNHYSYGSVVEWMYRHMCGICPMEDVPGYSRFELRPEPNCRIYGAKAEYDSPKGKIRIGWKRTDEEVMYMKITVPFDTVADVYLPYAETETVKMFDSGMLSKTEMEQIEHQVKIKLTAGTYEIQYPLTKKYCQGYSVKNTLEELKANPKTKEILYECIPMLDYVPAEFFEGNVAVGDVLNGPIRMSKAMDVDAVIERLNQKLGKILVSVSGDLHDTVDFLKLTYLL